MVLVQVLGYFKVNDTRVRKKSARAAAKAERERKAVQKEQKAASDSCISATMNRHMPRSDIVGDTASSPHPKDSLNGRYTALADEYEASKNEENIQNIEDSTTEPSSEEEAIA